MAAWLRLGTRGSPLAMVQAHETRDRLVAAHCCEADAVEIVVIRTSGDMIQDRALSEAGGKGLFTKELDIAMIDGRIDIAVHSAKDLPTDLPPEIALAGCLPREDVRDVLISGAAASIEALPQGAVVGSASLRREALLRRLRPDLSCVLLRGNVETRLRKVEAGEVDATMLAMAGLKRLGLADRATTILEVADFLPAVGQGAIAITRRVADDRTQAILDKILHADTTVALQCERAFLKVLDGSCRTPIAGHAQLAGGRLKFRGLVLRRDGTDLHETACDAPRADAERMGAAAGADLLARAPADILQMH